MIVVRASCAPSIANTGLRGQVNDVSITHLTFGPEYTRAIEAKQVAQQVQLRLLLTC